MEGAASTGEKAMDGVGADGVTTGAVATVMAAEEAVRATARAGADMDGEQQPPRPENWSTMTKKQKGYWKRRIAGERR